MESLNNLEPYDGLEDWSDDVDLFMETICHPHHMADALWQEAKLKKQEETSEPQKHPASRSSTSPRPKSQTD